MKMPNMCPFEKGHFLTWNHLNPRFGRNWDTFLKKFTNGTFKTLQMKVFGPKKFQIPCRESKVPNWQFLIWHFWFPAWNLKFFVSKYLHLRVLRVYHYEFHKRYINILYKNQKLTVWRLSISWIVMVISPTRIRQCDDDEVRDYKSRQENTL